MNYFTNLKSQILIIFLIFLSSIGFFINLFESSKTGPEFNTNQLEYPYIDSACKWSKLGLLSWSKEINKNFNSEISFTFYNHPSNIFCQGRPVISNLYSKKMAVESKEILPIGIGVNPNIDNLQNTGKYILFYIILLIFFNKFRLGNIKSLRVPLIPLIYMFLIFIFYGYFVFPSILNGITDIFLSIIIGNIIIYYLINSHPIDVVLKSTMTLIIFPLFYYDTNISFWWLFLLSSISYFSNHISIKTRTRLLLIALLLFLSKTIKDFNFKQKTYINEWILFTNHRHKGGIVDINNGSQSMVYLIDIFILIFVFYVLFKRFNIKSGSLEKDFSFSLILGFLIWFISYFASQLNPIINYFIYKQFGLNEHIDTIESYQVDGLNWRGVTSSHELTGFWLLIIFCILIKKIIKDKKLTYLPLLFFNLISINWNSQRTTLILMMLFFLYIVVTSLKIRQVLSTLFFSILFIFIISPYSEAINRLENRIDSIDFNYEIDSQLRWHINESFKRYEKYNLDISKPSYDFKSIKSYEEFYQKELNTNNKLIIDTFSFLTKVFGREFQWFRYFYFTELDSQTLLFGNGAGQSHQHLVLLIEKPHSLYFSMFYQYGLLGIILLMILFLKILFKFFKSNFNYVYLLGLFFFIAGIKAELIFTHNQFVFFVCFILYCFFIENKANKIN